MLHPVLFMGVVFFFSILLVIVSRKLKNNVLLLHPIIFICFYEDFDFLRHGVLTCYSLHLQYPFFLGFCVALSWSVLVCVSRVYMGMHSVLVSRLNNNFKKCT